MKQNHRRPCTYMQEGDLGLACAPALQSVCRLPTNCRVGCARILWEGSPWKPLAEHAPMSRSKSVRSCAFNISSWRICLTCSCSFIIASAGMGLLTKSDVTLGQAVESGIKTSLWFLVQTFIASYRSSLHRIWGSQSSWAPCRYIPWANSVWNPNSDPNWPNLLPCTSDGQYSTCKPVNSSLCLLHHCIDMLSELCVLLPWRRPLNVHCQRQNDKNEKEETEEKTNKTSQSLLEVLQSRKGKRR